jgi:hypothetical protein
MRVRKTIRPITTFVAFCLVLFVQSPLVVVLVERAFPMFRTAFGLSCIAILFAATGCQMCSHPYDCSGPVYSQDGSCSGGRAGSILGGAPEISTPVQGQDQPTGQATSYASARPRSKVSRQPASFGAADTRPRSMVSKQPTSFGAADNWSPSGVAGLRGQTGQTEPGYVPGSERIISVTERVVKSAGDSPQVTEESSPESSKPMSSSGWTARRPTSEVMR